jgi:lysozyme
VVNDPVLIAAILCRRFEGLRLRPYLCPAGVATIGYGSTFYENGVRVTLHDTPITKERAELLLIYMLRTVYMPAVIRLCPDIDCPLRMAAIIDFTFNLGAANLKNSTLRRRINADNWGDVPTQLRRWVRGGGVVLRGLVIRREAEASLV